MKLFVPALLGSLRLPTLAQAGDPEIVDLVKDMMQSDLKLMQKQQYLKDGGYRIKNYFE